MAKKKNLADKVDKRHRARVQVGRSPDGRPEYRYVQGRTKTELAANKKELQRLAARGRLEDNQITVFEYAKRWLAERVLPRCSAATIEMYRGALNAHILPAIGARYLAAVKPEELQCLLNARAGKSTSLVRQITLTIKRLFSRAAADGIIPFDPSTGLEMPQTVAGTRRALTADETAAALAAGERHPEGLLLLVLYYTGVRKGEAVGLQWQDINWAQHNMHVQRDIDFHAGDTPGALKTLAADRIIPIPDPLYDALKARRGIGSSYVLQALKGGNLGHSSYRRRWRELTDAMAEYLGEGVKLTAHYFRHNYASILYAAGVPLEVAANWLGHADINVTRQIYLHLAHATLVQQSVGLLKFFNGCQTVARKPSAQPSGQKEKGQDLA